MATDEVRSRGRALAALMRRYRDRERHRDRDRHRYAPGERHRATGEPGNVPSVHHVRHDRATHPRPRRAGAAGPVGVRVTTSWPGVGPAPVPAPGQQPATGQQSAPGQQPATGPSAAPVPTPRAPASDADLVARIAMIYEQLMMARAEVVLGRAAFERACEDEAAANPWLHDAMRQLTSPRIRRALAIRLAAVDRFRLWAQELDWLQREARARGLLTFAGVDREPISLP